jgi:O-antigen/teichoic acid export membrane protein
MRLHLRDIMETLSARGIAMLGPLVVSIITARALGPADRGQYFLVLAYTQIAIQLANLGLQASNTYLAANKRELLGQLTVNALYVALFVAPLVAVPIALFFGWPQVFGLAAAGPKTVGPLSLTAVLLAPLGLAYLYVSNLAIGVGRVKLFNGLTIAYSLLAVICSCLTWAFGGGTFYFLVAAGGATALTTVFVGWKLLYDQSLSISFDVELFRQGLGYAFRAYLASAFAFLILRVGVLALQNNADLANVGFFSIAAQLTDGIAQLPNTIALLLFPLMIRIARKERRKALWRTLCWLLLTMAFVLGIGTLVSPWLIPLLFGKAYLPSISLTIAMFPQLFILSAIMVLSQFLAAEGFPWIQVYAWALGFVLQTVLSYLLTEIWGGFGVAASLAVSYAVVLCILLVGVFSNARAGTQHEAITT